MALTTEHPTLARLLYIFLALASLSLGAIGAPMPYFKRGGECYNAWGYKADCTQLLYTIKTPDLQICEFMIKRLQVGGTFEILGNLFMGAALIMSLFCCYVIKRNWCKKLCMFLSVSGAISWVFVVAFMTSCWDVDVCFSYSKLGSFKDQQFGLGSGAALCIVAWVTATVNAVTWFLFDPVVEEETDTKNLS